MKKITVKVPKWIQNLFWNKKAFLRRLKGNHVRDWMKWGTYGKEGDQPLKYVILKDMSDEHIKAILRTQPHIKGHFYEKQFNKELKRREKNPNLSIKE